MSILPPWSRPPRAAARRARRAHARRAARTDRTGGSRERRCRCSGVDVAAHRKTGGGQLGLTLLTDAAPRDALLSGTVGSHDRAFRVRRVCVYACASMCCVLCCVVLCREQRQRTSNSRRARTFERARARTRASSDNERTWGRRPLATDAHVMTTRVRTRSTPSHDDVNRGAGRNRRAPHDAAREHEEHALGARDAVRHPVERRVLPLVAPVEMAVCWQCAT